MGGLAALHTARGVREKEERNPFERQGLTAHRRITVHSTLNKSPPPAGARGLASIPIPWPDFSWFLKRFRVLGFEFRISWILTRFRVLWV